RGLDRGRRFPLWPLLPRRALQPEPRRRFHPRRAHPGPAARDGPEPPSRDHPRDPALSGRQGLLRLLTHVPALYRLPSLREGLQASRRLRPPTPAHLPLARSPGRRGQRQQEVIPSPQRQGGSRWTPCTSSTPTATPWTTRSRTPSISKSPTAVAAAA